MCHSSLCDRVMLSGGCATSTPVVVRGLFHHPFRCRWALHCSAWELNDDDKHYFLSLIPLEERAACTRFARPEDCKRALASRVLQRLLGSLVFHVPLPSVKISRSASGKPFFAAVHSSSRIDFNVSHEVSIPQDRILNHASRILKYLLIVSSSTYTQVRVKQLSV